MDSVEPYINSIIALLSLAYPILLQVISRLDEKYSSDNIIDLFDKEKEFKAFKYSLYASLICILIWSLKLKAYISIDGLNWFINNSAIILLSLSTISLVVFFFLFVNKILIYYTPTKIISYLIKKHNKKGEGFYHFTALGDILILSIKHQQKNISLTLSDFFYSAFHKVRESARNQVEYPDAFYELVYKSIEELAILSEKRNYALEYRTAGGIWLLGESQGKEISEKTYMWLWRNLNLGVQYKHDDMILYHWGTAHQYFEYSLPIILPEIDYSKEGFKILNEVEKAKRDQERSRFIEFHFFLGGLLLYKKRYSCLKRVFQYTDSQPPTFPLLPDSMGEIFGFYFEVSHPYTRKYDWINHKYPFPQQSGLNAEYIIKKWVGSYMGLLFLRQYTIVPYLTTMRPLDFPSIPKSQGEIMYWINGLVYFKKLVEEHLQNVLLLEELNLGFLTPQWCQENNKVYPLDFIDQFKAKLQEEYDNNSRNLPISEEKANQFKTSTKNSIESAFTEISRISNNTEFKEEESEKWNIHGQFMLQGRDAFTEEPEVHHMNFDSILGESIAQRCLGGLATTFLKKKSRSYLIKPEEIFQAIDKLKISEEHVIVGFGFDIKYYTEKLKVPGLTIDKYKNVPIYLFKGFPSVDSSLFILKKNDLPKITSLPIHEDIIRKFGLEKNSENINLYTSIIDMNATTADIFNENMEGKSEDELKKHLLLSVRFDLEIKWRKNIIVIKLEQYSEYLHKGLINNLNEIDPFNPKVE